MRLLCICYVLLRVAAAASSTLRHPANLTCSLGDQYIDDSEASLPSLKAQLERSSRARAGAEVEALEDGSGPEGVAGLRLAYALCCWYQGELLSAGWALAA